MGKMIFSRCSSTWSDQGRHHMLVIFHLNSKYYMRKINARKRSFEWKQPNSCRSNCLELSDHQSCVIKMDIQPTTYWPLVSHKFIISDQKLKKLYEENKHLSKILPMKLTKFLLLYSFGNGSKSKLLLHHAWYAKVSAAKYLSYGINQMFLAASVWERQLTSWHGWNTFLHTTFLHITGPKWIARL